MPKKEYNNRKRNTIKNRNYQMKFMKNSIQGLKI